MSPILLSNVDLFRVMGINFETKGITSIFYNGMKLFLTLTLMFLSLMGIFKLAYKIKN